MCVGKSRGVFENFARECDGVGKLMGCGNCVFVSADCFLVQICRYGIKAESEKNCKSNYVSMKNV